MSYTAKDLIEARLQIKRLTDRIAVLEESLKRAAEWIDRLQPSTGHEGACGPDMGCDGFETGNTIEAGAHFGDGDGEPAICMMWAELSSDERLQAFQQMVMERDAERTENESLRAASQWRPIAEAPKDRPVKLLVQRWGCWDSTSSAWYDDTWSVVDPTHYMPAPLAPEPKEATL